MARQGKKSRGPLDKVLTVADCVKHRATIESTAGGLGYTLTVHNEGQHQRFLSPFGAVDWWPSTGRWAVRQVVQGGRVHTLSDLRVALTAAAKIKEAPSRSVAKEETTHQGTCGLCGQPSEVVDLTGYCRACTYGEAPR